MNRLGECEEAPAGSRLQARRSRRRHRAPARSGAVRGLRRRRMGHVPQRPIHRARHQGSATVTAASSSASSRIFSSSSIRHCSSSACCWSRPAWSPRPGSTSSASAPAPVLAAARRAGHRRRTGRPAGGDDRRAARLRRACSRPQQRRPKPKLVRESRRAPITPAIWATLEPDIVIECTGADPVMLDVLGARRAGRHRLPRRRLRRRPHDSVSTSANSTAAWCWRTTSCSARSTPIAATTATPPPRWPRPTRAGCARLITRRVPLDHWQEALEARPDDVKVILDFTA